jgi:hypothetical protein
MRNENQPTNLPGIPLPNFTLSLGQRLKISIKFGIQSAIEFAKYSYLALVFILLLCALVEIKSIFKIDLFPGIDTPIDNAYFAGKDQLELNVL